MGKNKVCHISHVLGEVVSPGPVGDLNNSPVTYLTDLIYRFEKNWNESKHVVLSAYKMLSKWLN